MAKYQGVWPLSWLCEALNVSRGGDYEWLKRSLSAHARRDEELLISIRRSFAEAIEPTVRVVFVVICVRGISCVASIGSND